MKKFLSIFFVLFLFGTTTVSANVIEEGYRSVGECFRIVNIDEYPNYTFVIQNLAVGDANEIIRDDECFGFPYEVEVSAIKRENFDEQDFNTLVELPYEEQRPFWDDNPDLLTAERSLVQNAGSVPEGDPVDSYEHVVEIVRLDGKVFEIDFVETITHYRDGTYVIKKLWDNPWGLVLALFLTVLIELFVYWVILKGSFYKNVKGALAINVITNPASNILFQVTREFWLIELGVFIVEIFLVKCFFGVNYKKAILISLVANLLSALIGMAIYALI